MADPYLREHARGHINADHAERELARAVRAAFRQYLTAVEHAVLDGQTSGNVTAARQPDTDLWPGPHIWRRLVDQLMPAIARIIKRGFNRFLTKQQRAELDENDYIQHVLDDTRERLTGATWPDEVYAAVREQIRAAHEAGDDLRATRRRVRSVLGPDQWTGRADTIARTESMSALVQGTWRAGNARQDIFDEKLRKRWIAVDDERTRHAHREADHQVVDYDDAFHVGGEQLQFPHDPTATPGNQINCRCVMTIEDAEESAQRDTDLADTTAATKGHMPGTLRRYWTHGKGAAKIRWGVKNDFYRCERHLRKYVPPHMVKGLCAKLHHRALGKWPGQEGAKKADAGGCAPCEDMTEQQIEEALAAMRDDPELQRELAEQEDTTDPEPNEGVDDEEPEQAPAETSDDGLTDVGVWALPGEDDVTEDDLDDGDGNSVTAGDFTPSGSPTAGKRKRAEKSRAAMKGGRFPIENGNDLRKAVMALGRAGGGPRGRAAVKAHIIRRAKALGLTSRLPDSWKSSSQSSTASSAATSTNGWYERVAERVPNQPPAGWFTDPELTGPTKVRVTDQGRVYGHIAAWDTEHASLPGVTARMFASDSLHRFHRHPIRTHDGERVRTGPLATGGHASTDDTVGLTAAQSHYDDPHFVAADVTVGKDQHGLWCSGSLRPGASPFQIMLLDRYSISGDWRNGELVAACSVSVPGFHLDDDQNVYALAADAGAHRPTLGDHRPRGRFEDDGHPASLVAAGVITTEPSQDSPQIDGWRLYREFQAAAAADQRVSDARRRIHAPRLADAARRVRQTS